jgi:hypothetical protein
MVAAQIAVRGALGRPTSLLPLRPSLVLTQTIRSAIRTIADVRLRRRAYQLLTSQPVPLLRVLRQIYPKRRGIRIGTRPGVSQHQQAHLLVNRVVVVHGWRRRLRLSSYRGRVHVLHVVCVERLL